MDTNPENESVDASQGIRASDNHSNNTQVSAISKQSIVYKTIFSWKFCKDKKIFITEQAADQNPDYEPCSIYDSMGEDNQATDSHDNTYDIMYEDD